jgi:chromate transport protein ChrA
MTSRAPPRRSADHRQSKPTTGSPSLIGAMYAGLAMTVIAIIVPYIDHATSNTLANHIRDGYPAYTHARIDTAATTYLVYLSIIGVLGVVGWLWTVRAIKTGKR